MRFLALSGVLLLVISVAVPVGRKDPKAAVTYATVKPIFQRNCVSCHSGPKPAHGLDLSTYAKIMKGDKEGKVVIRGKPKMSRMIKAIKGKGAKAMPPGKPLQPRAARTLEDWVHEGCPND